MSKLLVSRWVGFSSTVASQLDGTVDVIAVYSTGSTGGAFAALRADGSVVTWGVGGGDSSSVANQLNGTVDVIRIYSNGHAFAALRTDGSVVTWGANWGGGDSSAVANQMNGTVDVSQIYATERAFAALRADGSVVTWGDSSWGGDSSIVASQLNGAVDITQIYSTEHAFAALRVDGSIVSWGKEYEANLEIPIDTSAVASKLTSGVVSGADISTDDWFTVVTNNAPTGLVSINDTTPKQGQTLIVSSTLADADGLGTIHYQWKANGTNIGTGANYTVTAADVGKQISVIAKYTDSLGNLETKASAATAAVTAVTNPGFTLTGNDFNTNENGDTATFTIKLNTAPTRDVSVTFTSLDNSEGIINKTLTFTSSNWSTAQTLTVTGTDDALMDSNISYQVKGVVNTLDVNYSGLTLNLITLTNQDNEVAGQSIYGDVGGSKNDVLVGTEGNDKLFGLNMKDDLSGRGGNDELWGGYDNDVLFGENGNDKLYGEQNDDYMEGGAGNDTLDGGLGIDTMKGGAGNDVYYLGYDAKDVIQDGGLATDIDTVIMPYQLTTYTLAAGIENATITTGTQAANLIGNAGNNGLTGNAGANVLNGAIGRDRLIAGAGNDVLIGGKGNDTLGGGAGKDVFKFNAALIANTDKITDFASVDDTIQLENAIFAKLTTLGVLNTANFKAGAAAADANDYLVYNNSTGALFYDADGNGTGAAVQIALLGNHATLTSADFVII